MSVRSEYLPLVNEKASTNEEYQTAAVVTRLKYVNMGMSPKDAHKSRRTAFTIDAGDAVAMFALPGPASAFDTFVLNSLNKGIVFYTPEQRKRRLEFVEKYTATTKAAFGDEITQMFALNILATSPKKQGTGYGTLLVKAVTDKADTVGRKTWLGSSDIANRKFYEGCGFVVVGEFTLGEANPTWTAPPVVIQIMLREPQSLVS
ncbi:uncharacterized protein FIBRA_00781 [Fibroporia radiculosa]|uniref:N-acetyltransferase domain-containing protein n=1 Tax=Fibroporia radiculosa TaxID=599839 RepID=J4I846_9APHY|nr:uncharacterized protein FIBRA_00781 [Fibroporia radiculosa]CCL98776.1 predicted protein [Fibroporia radiculosa]